MQKKIIMIAMSLVIMIAAGLSILTSAHASSHEIKRQKLIEAAKKEGQLNAILTWPPVSSEPILGAFKRAYPFIDVRQTRMSGREGFERIRAEFASGRRSIDIINAGIVDFEEAGMVQRWEDWLEIFPETNKRTVHPTLAASKEPPTIYGLVYRTDLVPSDLQPLTHAKLADKRLSDKKIGFNIRQYDVIPRLYPKYSDEELIRYFEEVIAPQNPRLCNGNAKCWEMLIRGEVWAMFATVHALFSRYLPRGLGNTVAIAADYGGVGEGKEIVFLKDAPHPNTAKVFLHWITTDEAQKIFGSARGRVDPYDTNNVVGAWAKKHGAKLFDHPEGARRKRTREIGAVFLEKLGLPVPKKKKRK